MTAGKRSVQREVVEQIVAYLRNEPLIEGAFLAGSLLDHDHDEYADVDLGIASALGKTALQAAYDLRHGIAAAVGAPVHHIERGWQHCQMIALLYGKTAFPPLGLEVDIIFSELRHVGEQMPYVPYEVVLDRSGRLKAALDRLPKEQPVDEVWASVYALGEGMPFFVHDALKAARRGDWFYLQQVLESMRQAIFQAAAAKNGTAVHGAKRAYRHLSQSERLVVRDSYSDDSPRSVERLAQLYVECISRVGADHRMAAAVEQLQRTLQEVRQEAPR